MAKIKTITAYEIIDSRGYPTLEGRLILDSGVAVVSSVPSGTSVGKYEALEVRDNDSQRYNGYGMLRAASYVNDLIGPKLVGVDPSRQQEVDYWLIKADGTKNKSRIGTNVILLVSQLIAKAAAKTQNLPLFVYLNQILRQNYKVDIKIDKIPTPMFNIINGGKHANNNIDFQEYDVIPSSSFSFSKAYQYGVEIFHELRRVLQYRNAAISVGEQGGLTPNFTTNIDALEAIKEAISQRNLRVGSDIFLGLDIAASHFYKDQRYYIKDKPHPLKSNEYFDFIEKMIDRYSLLVVEDPFDQDSWEWWKKITESSSENAYIVGDDLLSTNKDRILMAIKEDACSTILIKPNQTGSISEVLEVVNIAKTNKLNYIVSNRSGETNDPFAADLAVAIQSDFVKFGAPTRGERVAKYNRLWQIEREELKKNSTT